MFQIIDVKFEGRLTLQEVEYGLRIMGIKDFKEQAQLMFKQVGIDNPDKYK